MKIIWKNKRFTGTNYLGKRLSRPYLGAFKESGELWASIEPHKPIGNFDKGKYASLNFHSFSRGLKSRYFVTQKAAQKHVEKQALRFMSLQEAMNNIYGGKR